MKRIKFLPLADDLGPRYKVVDSELIPVLEEKASSVPIKDIVQSKKYDKEEDSTFYYVRSNCLTPCTLQTYKRKCSRVFPSHRIAKIQIAKMLNKSPFLS